MSQLIYHIGDGILENEFSILLLCELVSAVLGGG